MAVTMGCEMEEINQAAPHYSEELLGLEILYVFVLVYALSHLQAL
ncbi:protein of unknown function [Petrocella atlantisensis]|uniref:Uncharacterized protein n=1 Tax=Petrocella atlantisensis TaxID=2173034 RepID=A0A3P7NSP1_9FIRM|nr:protein of unknown function [Petrocella atlantisensis]